MTSMPASYRQFEAGPDPWGTTWTVEFRWLQNAITIRHEDGVDVKFFLRSGDTLLEKIVALYHPHLLALSRRLGREITDAWCMKLAALHIKRIIETGQDWEKTLVKPSMAELEDYAAELETAPAR